MSVRRSSSLLFPLHTLAAAAATTSTTKTCSITVACAPPPPPVRLPPPPLRRPRSTSASNSPPSTPTANTAFVTPLATASAPKQPNRLATCSFSTSPVCMACHPMSSQHVTTIASMSTSSAPLPQHDSNTSVSPPISLPRTPARAFMPQQPARPPSVRLVGDDSKDAKTSCNEHHDDDGNTNMSSTGTSAAVPLAPTPFIIASVVGEDVDDPLDEQIESESLETISLKQHHSPSHSPSITIAASTSSSEGDVESDAALSTSTVTSVDSNEPSSLGDVEEDGKSGGQQQAKQEDLSFKTGVAFVPHPEKVDKGGEDAFFMHDKALGVFDGVGGWSNVGVDAGLYSKELARLTAEHVENGGPSTIVHALKCATILNRAIGSSTACVVGLNGDRMIGVNLGDSGLIVIRGEVVVFKSEEQQHYFNCPYQVGTDSLDTVDVGAPVDFVLKDGDCVVMGTDGLWDNVFQKDVVDIVVRHSFAINGNDTTTTCSSTDGRTRDSISSSSSASSSASSSSTSESEREQARKRHVVLAGSSSGNRSEMKEKGSGSNSDSDSDSGSNSDSNTGSDSGSEDSSNFFEMGKKCEHSDDGEDGEDGEDDKKTRNIKDGVQRIAEALADAAIKVANDKRCSCPFSVNARNAGHIFVGGKVDDITVLVAVVVERCDDGEDVARLTKERGKVNGGKVNGGGGESAASNVMCLDSDGGGAHGDDSK